MLRAIELARNGLGKVSPNPMVGCVIVKNGRIIGEGWHQFFGGPHAEVNAIKSVTDSKMLEGSDVYVNLEPCAHHGKTPPCADLLVSYKVGRVFIANEDINPLVHGKGIALLEKAGVKVKNDVLSVEGKNLNKRFFNFHEKKRPYVILKWAETADGYMARDNFDAKWISNEYSRQIVHKWRSEEDAIMVGANTVIYDNPKLNVRDWEGRDPIRIILDPDLKCPEKANVLDETQITLIYNTIKSSIGENTRFIKVESKNYLKNVFADLFKSNIQSVLIEGGPTLLNSVIEEGFWDEARIFRSVKTFGSGLAAPRLKNGTLSNKIRIFDDDLYIFNFIEP
jgi:diaminohydroxyphosphoribosylaminopyrimidine deaminase/5-amino-6-(5-phosphoribosylamino)uracil reductase